MSTPLPNPTYGADKRWASELVRSLTNRFDALGAKPGVAATQVDLRGGAYISVKDPPFKAIGDGVADDTAAFSASIAALPATGGSIFIPTGAYKIGSSITVNKPVNLFGASRFASVIVPSNATGDVFDVTSPGCAFSNMQFNPSVTHTAGSFIRLRDWYAHVMDVDMYGYYVGVKIESIFARVVHCTMQNGTPDATAAGSAGIWVSGPTCGGWVIDDVQMDAGAGSQPTAGIRLQDCLDGRVVNCNIVHHGKDVLIDPGNGQAVVAVKFAHSYFDTALWGLVTAPTGTGQVARLQFTACDFTSMANSGVGLFGGGGAVDGAEFNGCFAHLCGVDGIEIADAAWVNVSIIGGECSGNVGSGVSVVANASKFKIIGLRSGQFGTFAGNAYGIFLAAGTGTDFLITDCMLLGNTTAPISDGAMGTRGVIRGNLGYNPVGISSPAPPATTATYTAGHSPETIYLSGGTVTAVKIPNNAGTTVFTTTPCTIELQPNESLSITYTVAPTMVRSIH